MATSKSTRKHYLPSTNKWAYNTLLRPVHDTEKLQKGNLVELCCCTTHCVRIAHVAHGEGDGLYAIFANCAGQDVMFMQCWLHYFIMNAYRIHFKCIGFNYLSRKGLDLDLWAEAIQDGWRADFFILYALSALLEIHALVHLRDGGIWLTMENPPDTHNELLSHCELHLAYMGWGCSLKW